MRGLNELLGKLNYALYNAVSEHRSEDVHAQTKEIGDAMSRAYSFYENTKLENEIKRNRQFIQAFRDSLEPDELVTYYMGMLEGFTECFSGLFTERIKSDKLKANPLKSQYYNKIIQILFQKEYVQHKDLAAALGIKVSSLTRIMKTIEQDDQTYIVASSVGKYKYYCLTDAGKKYHAQYINQERWMRPEEAIEEMLVVIKKRLDTNQENLLISYATKCYPYDYHIAKKTQELESSIRRNIRPAAKYDVIFRCFEKVKVDQKDFQIIGNVPSLIVNQAIAGLGEEVDGNRPFSKENKVEMVI